MTEKEQNVRVL